MFNSTARTVQAVRVLGGVKMKCYFCKKEITRSTRPYVPPRNRREKGQHRDLCKPCYLQFMADNGYILAGNVWKREEVI